MRYLKGYKVEVLNEQELPSGSWRCAEVVCSNRYYVTVRHDMYNTNEVMLEKVGRNLVRPCPPASEHTQNWIPGDVIEVYHNFSWKMATVSKVLKKNHFMVRLVGSSTKFKVHEFNTRPRQSWLDEKWVLVGQGSGDQNDRGWNETSFVNYHWLPSSQGKAIKRNANSSEENDLFKNVENICFRGSCIVLPKSLKRGSPYCSQGRIQKYRFIEKDGGCDQVVAGDPYCMPDNRMVGGGNEVCSLVDDGMISATHQELFRINYEAGKFSARRHESDDPDTSSVGSCSIDTIYPLHSRILAFPADNAADHSSDAESTCQSRDEDLGFLSASRNKLAAEIHRARLEAPTFLFQVLKMMLGLQSCS